MTLYWVRVLLLSVLAFNIGLLVYLMVGYARGRFSPEDPPMLRRALTGVSLSYLLFMLYMGYDGLERTRQDAPFGMRTVLGASGIVLGAVGLVSLARVIAYIFGGKR